jgi:hypothetical protein
MISASGHDFSAQLILDMRTDDLVECGLGLESEITGALGVEALGPAGNDSLDKFVGLAPDARSDFFAGNTAQCFDLFPDRA